METDMALMDAWREKSNKIWAVLKQAYANPGLFKKEYVEELTTDIQNAEKHFNAWRDSGN